MSERHTFCHSFGKDFTCTVENEPALNPAARQIRPRKYWHPRPSAEDYEAFFPQYVQWMHSVNTQLARIHQADHIFVLQDRYAKQPFWQKWLYRVNGEKKCIATGHGPYIP